MYSKEYERPTSCRSTEESVKRIAATQPTKTSNQQEDVGWRTAFSHKQANNRTSGPRSRKPRHSPWQNDDAGPGNMSRFLSQATDSFASEDCQYHSSANFSIVGPCPIHIKRADGCFETHRRGPLVHRTRQRSTTLGVSLLHRHTTGSSWSIFARPVAE